MMIDYNKILPKNNSSPKNINNRLPWQLSNKQKTLIDVMNNKSFLSSPHKWFNGLLRSCEICDLEQIEVPGAMIMLPWGIEVMERLATIIREVASKEAYEEYAYPSLIPNHYFNPVSDLIDIQQAILPVYSKHSETKPSLALIPTGEYPIYKHWHSVIKTKNDLPLRIYQRAKYFRPISSSKRSGGSVFVSMEASDVFEFHACFTKSDLAIKEADKLLLMFKQVCESIGTTVLWSLRPSWTNHGRLYQWSFGGDAMLPSKYTVQVCCAYFQGDTFSKRFNITFLDNETKCFTEQSTGAITKRLMFANLFQTAKLDRSLYLHPNLSPKQVIILLNNYNVDDEYIFDNIDNELSGLGVRVKLIKIDTKSQFHREEKKWYRRGVPLIVLAFGRKNHSHIKTSIKRNDTNQEITFNYQNCIAFICSALKDLSDGFQIINKYQTQFVSGQHTLDMRTILDQHQVAILPLSIKKQSVYEIEKLHKGEVLGFFQGEEKEACFITGEKVLSKVFVSRRI